MLRSVFNRLRMKLWVIRSGRENASRARRPLPRCETAQKRTSIHAPKRGISPSQTAIVNPDALPVPRPVPKVCTGAPRVPHRAEFVIHRPCGQQAVQVAAGSVRFAALTWLDAAECTCQCMSLVRSEERRVGKECRSRGGAGHV